MPELFFHSYFSPGVACRDAICEQLQRVVRSVDICVFTICDNVIAHAILDAFNEGAAIRIISDNDKVFDLGSDIRWLHNHGIEIRVDNTHHHMHHKFAIFDDEVMLTGSYNWTRSAAEWNQENVLVTNAREAIDHYKSEFERLWETMKPFESLV